MEHILVRTNGSQANQATALRNRELFEMANITVINLMSAPGAGKTSLLEATIPGLRGWYEVAVIEGDSETELDAERIRALGVPSHQINTGKVSHLDALVINSALTEFPVQGVDLLVIENVGNLICPAYYDLGEKLRLVVCSAVDGSDAPKKYPMMFRRADAIVVNKVDLAASGGAEVAELRRNLREANTTAPIFGVSCRTGVGLGAWLGWMRNAVARRDVLVATNA
jgi:hydrogenase nickel incorporation protein HypB